MDKHKLDDGNWREGYALAVRHCQALVKSWTVNQELLLRAGEMTPQEIRTVKAVLNSVLGGEIEGLTMSGILKLTGLSASAIRSK